MQDPRHLVERGTAAIQSGLSLADDVWVAPTDVLVLLQACPELLQRRRGDADLLGQARRMSVSSEIASSVLRQGAVALEARVGELDCAGRDTGRFRHGCGRRRLRSGGWVAARSSGLLY